MTLFCYGTLMFPPVLERLISHAYTLQPAVLQGYTRYCVKNQVYPGVVREPGGQTDGLILHPIGPSQLKKLDAYEGASYQRLKLQVHTSQAEVVNAWCYVIPQRGRYLLANNLWRPERFLACHLSSYLRSL